MGGRSWPGIVPSVRPVRRRWERHRRRRSADAGCGVPHSTNPGARMIRRKMERETAGDGGGEGGGEGWDQGLGPGGGGGLHSRKVIRWNKNGNKRAIFTSQLLLMRTQRSIFASIVGGSDRTATTRVRTRQAPALRTRCFWSEGEAGPVEILPRFLVRMRPHAPSETRGSGSVPIV
jgi:hypothetical protein